MGILDRVFNRRQNVSTVTDEALVSSGSTYMDVLVRNNRLYFHDYRARYFVSLQDAVASRLVYYLAERLTMHTPVFYDDHQGQEIMEDHKAALDDLNWKELLLELFENLIRDGHALWDPTISLNDEGTGVIDWDVFGDLESRPQFWTRAGNGRNLSDPNQILAYMIWFIPQPYDTSWFRQQTAGVNTHGVRKFFTSNQIFHFTRGKWNHGFGNSLLLRAWDAITKLRIASNSDSFLRDIRGQVYVPTSWKQNKIQKFMQTLDEWTAHRWLVIKSEQNPTTKEPTGLPSVGMRTLGEDSNPKPLNQKSSTGETLMDPEYGRMFIATALSKMWWIGSEVGNTMGGEVNASQDILDEIQQFAILENVVKRVVMYFAEIGAIPPLPTVTDENGVEKPGKFVIKYWRDDQIMKAQAAMVQQQEFTNGLAEQEANINNKPEEDRADSKPTENVSLSNLSKEQLEAELDMANSDIEWALGKIGSTPAEERRFQKLLDEADARYRKIEIALRRFNVSLSTEADLDREIRKTEIDINELEEAIKFELEEIEEEGKEKGVLRALQSQKRKFHTILQSLLNLKQDRFNMCLEVWSLRENAPPNQWVGVSSTSGLQAVRYVPGQPGIGGVAPSMDAKFKGGAQYKIQDPTNLPDPEGAVDAITGKGSAGQSYWELVRAGPGGPQSPAPLGLPKTGNPQQFAYAGKAHYTDYALLGGGVSKKTGKKKTGVIPGVGGRKIPSFSQIVDKARVTAPVFTTPPLATKATAVKPVLAATAAQKTASVKPTLKISGVQKSFITQVSKSQLANFRKQSLSDLSRAQFKEITSNTIDHTFGSESIDRIKKLIKNYSPVAHRFNSVFEGTPMDFDIALYYRNKMGGVDVEYACKRDWKRDMVGKHKVNIGHDHNHIVALGWYDWDEETDKPTVKTDIDREALAQYMVANGLDKKHERLFNKVITGEKLPLSTEYDTSIQLVGNKAFQRNFRNAGMALVDQGNCPDNLCSIAEVE